MTRSLPRSSFLAIALAACTPSASRPPGPTDHRRRDAARGAVGPPAGRDASGGTAIEQHCRGVYEVVELAQVQTGQTTSGGVAAGFGPVAFGHVEHVPGLRNERDLPLPPAPGHRAQRVRDADGDRRHGRPEVRRRTATAAPSSAPARRPPTPPGSAPCRRTSGARPAPGWTSPTASSTSSPWRATASRAIRSASSRTGRGLDDGAHAGAGPPVQPLGDDLRPAGPRRPGATARVRIFTPGFEMPFAGHPTLGTAHVVRSLRPGAVTGSCSRWRRGSSR